MKNLFIALLLVLFCVGAYARHANNINKTKLTTTQLLKGKLYLRASIFRGLNLSWLYLGNDGVFVINPKTELTQLTTRWKGRTMPPILVSLPKTAIK